MARELSPLNSVLMVLAFILARTLVVASQPQVPCYFIFGDSLVDNGNNNNLRTMAKANYPPYGIDFPEGVSGRFTNNRTLADIIGQLLGFPNFIPPYANLTGQVISTGVNYGSGGAGIREESGRNLGDRISLSRQLVNHLAITSRLTLMQRNATFTKDYLKKCIYIVNMGSNDYINNYFKPNDYPTSQIYNTDRYAEVLMRQYSIQLKTLYTLGARKIAVFGLGLIGCTPAEIAMFRTGGPCVDSINDAVRLFNDRLKPLIDQLNNDNPDARFTFINITSISAPQGGESAPNIPCCPTREDGQCVPNSIPCPVRDLSAYYDGFHPSDIANLFLATRSFNAVSSTDASPYDISRLAQL